MTEAHDSQERNTFKERIPTFHDAGGVKCLFIIATESSLFLVKSKGRSGYRMVGQRLLSHVLYLPMCHDQSPHWSSLPIPPEELHHEETHHIHRSWPPCRVRLNISTVNHRATRNLYAACQNLSCEARTKTGDNIRMVILKGSRWPLMWICSRSDTTCDQHKTNPHGIFLIRCPMMSRNPTESTSMDYANARSKGPPLSLMGRALL